MSVEKPPLQLAHTVGESDTTLQLTPVGDRRIPDCDTKVSYLALLWEEDRSEIIRIRQKSDGVAQVTRGLAGTRPLRFSTAAAIDVFAETRGEDGVGAVKNRCRVTGVDPSGKPLPYQCCREAGHKGSCAMDLDPSVTREDPVRPQHYKLTIENATVVTTATPDVSTAVTCEVIDVVEALGYQDDAYLATALIYLMRLRRKEQPVVDVKKAIWWLQRWIERQEPTDG